MRAFIRGQAVFLALATGDINLATVLEKASKDAGLPYGLVVEVDRSNNVHLVLPREHFTRTARGEEAHKAYIGCKALVVAYDALIALGVDSKSLSDHTYGPGRNNDERVPTLGIWFNGVEVGSGQGGGQTIVQADPQARVEELTAKFMALGGDIVDIPERAAGIQCAWLSQAIAKLETSQAQASIGDSPAETEGDEAPVAIEGM